MVIIHAVGMDRTYDAYVDDACFNNHDFDDDTDHDTGDDNGDDTDNGPSDETDDGADDGGRGNLHSTKVPACRYR